MHDSGNILKNWFFEKNSAKKIKCHTILSFYCILQTPRLL
jgi:hypothetical protein